MGGGGTAGYYMPKWEWDAGYALCSMKVELQQSRRPGAMTAMGWALRLRGQEQLYLRRACGLFLIGYM